MQSEEHPQVLIVGAGPAGLAAARALSQAGIGDVLVIDRDDAPGGLPRFCGHPGFGLEYAGWPYSGPGFAAKLLRDLAGSKVRIECGTTLIALKEGPQAAPAAEIVGPRLGVRTLRPRAVILATGIREANRGNLQIPGGRAERGIMTTGQLQQIVARKSSLPPHLKSVAVIGTEHVAFSAIWTARHAGLKVAALIGAENRVMSFAPLATLARLFGIPVLTGAKLREIETVQGAVKAIHFGDGQRLACDGIVFTAGWIPETAALLGGPVMLDPRTGGPEIDQAMRTSCPGIFAAGNLLHGVESSGWCAREGRHAGEMAARYLKGELPATQGGARFTLDDDIAYLVPQRWDGDVSAATPPTLRMKRDISSARIALDQGGNVIWSGQETRLLQRRRVKLELGSIAPGDQAPRRVRIIR
jgi:thioredoxin reductase